MKIVMKISMKMGTQIEYFFWNETNEGKETTTTTTPKTR